MDTGRNNNIISNNKNDNTNGNNRYNNISTSGNTWNAHDRMDCNKTGNSKKTNTQIIKMIEMSKAKRNENGDVIKKCKQCGKEFTHKTLLNYCKECLNDKKIKNIKEFYNKNGEEKRKRKWREKLVICKVNTPIMEKWNDTFNPSVTTEECTYCGQVHTEGDIYYHRFMGKTDALAIEISDLYELIEDIIKIKEKGKNIFEIIMELGLDKRNVTEGIK